MAELLARLRAVLRRDEGGQNQARPVVIGRWLIDMAAHQVRRASDAARADAAGADAAGRDVVAGRPRSEEHTSELQSQSNLVCRLLLEKKKEQHVRHYMLA